MTKLRTYPAHDWPRPAPWLVPEPNPDANCTQLGFSIVIRGDLDDGVAERPLGSNLGIRLTTILGRYGQKPPQFWCGYWIGDVWVDCHAMVPENFWAVDSWLEHMLPVKHRPKTIHLNDIAEAILSTGVQLIDIPGAAIIYGRPGDGKHIGSITRFETEPDTFILTREGNRGYGGVITDNGVCVDQAPPSRTDILGIVVPQKAP